MSVRPRPKNARGVVALIATRGRDELLRLRALPSILAQSHLPDRVVVVVDQSKEELSDSALAKLDDSLQSQCGEGVPLTVLRNRRTPQRAAGAWNSGIDHLHRDARLMAHPDLCYVAVLDDDDSWEPPHLEACLEEAVAGDLSMVAAGLIRHETPDDGGRRQDIPERLDAREQFIRGQHIQGSNLFVRLDAMLSVGMFDERLRSCTDRDLCIRLSRLPDFHFGSVARHTVHHYADARPDRLSAPGSPAKLEGLTAFWHKHADRFDTVAQAEAAARARTLFGWTLPESRLLVQELPLVGAPARAVSLVVGFVTDAVPPGHVSGLLDDLVALDAHSGIAALHVVVIENGPVPVGGERVLHGLAAQYRDRGLDLELVTLERQREDWAQGRLIDTPDPTRQRLKIALSRTVLNTYVARAAGDRPGAWAWVLDDDKRLTMLVERGDGSTVERSSPDLGVLCALKDRGVDIVIGPDTEAAPLPFTATLRMQLVDLEHLFGVLGAVSPNDIWPDRSGWNHAARSSLRDSYYDLSKHTEHLQTPLTLPPVTAGCTAADMLKALSPKIGRLLAGEAVFRPLTVEAESLAIDEAVDSVQRGGSTIFFDPRVLLEYPQSMARFGERYVRRSDMLVTQLMRDQLGLRIFMHPAAGVRHDRSCTRRAHLDDATLWEDVLGFALYRAANELLLNRTPSQRRGPLLAWTGLELKEAVRLVRKNINERLAAVTLNSWAIVALADAVRRAAARLSEGPAWSTPSAQGHFAVIAKEMDRIRGNFRPSAVAEFASCIRDSVNDADIRNTFTSMDGLISEYRSTHPQPKDHDATVLAAREARCRALLKKAWGVKDLRRLGAGGEGVVFTDELRVYKVFDLLKRRPKHDTLETLRALRDRTEEPKHLYPLVRLESKDEVLLLAYPYEPSEEYSGGRGPELIALLRECKAYGFVFRNMHPKNLRVCSSGLKLVDYGSDIRPFSEAGYRSMAERAWLTYRWPHRADLEELMRRALTDKSLPELDGFERFWTALTDDKPSATRVVAAMVDPLVLDSGARSVLDYGCGKKARSARRLAQAGLRSVGFDPGSGMQERWSGLPPAHGHVTLTSDRSAALAGGPYDAVVCSLVLCELADGPEYERVLADLRGATSHSGVLFISLCNPMATFGGPTPLHRRRDLPPGVTYEDSFAYTENAETGVGRREFHRSLRRVERDLLRHGIRVERRVESRTVDLERFEPASDFLTLVCRPVFVEDAHCRVSLLMKCCAMEAHTIERQVDHLVGQLERPRAFHERVLAIDSRQDGFVRQHAAPDWNAIREAAARLLKHGMIDRVVYGPEHGAASHRINRDWFGLDCESTHTKAGAPLAMPLFGFEDSTGEYILQVDSDLFVGRTDSTHDYLGEMIGALEANPNAVCSSLNIARDGPLPFSCGENGQPWRVEVRGCLLHRARLMASRPFPNRVEDGQPAESWHRSLDRAAQEGRVASLRGGGHQTYFIHPPNELKRSVADWMLMLDLVEKGHLPQQQVGHVDLVGGPLSWLPKERAEPVVFIVTGRNVPPGRAARCLASMEAQSRKEWGAVVIDDGSSEWCRESLRLALAPWTDRVTLLQPRERRGQLANMALAVRHVCTDPESVIITLDLDDALLGPTVVERVLSEHVGGADVTVGSMLRIDKHVEYPVNFDNPRGSRGGNVWQHLRSFRKRLFDAIPDHELRVCGRYVDIAVDWAFMIPIVEMAEQPVWIREPLYLYEPSGLGKGPDRNVREKQIASIASMTARRPRNTEPPEPLLLPEQLSSRVWSEAGGIVFLRHGERPSFAGLDAAQKDAVKLTDAGRRAASSLGGILGDGVSVVSSPVPRAFETAVAIAETVGRRDSGIHKLDALVNFRLADTTVYEAVKRRLGWAGLMAEWMDGSLDAGILIPCHEVARSAIRDVLETAGSAAHPRVVAITHDFMIMALLAALRGVRRTAVPYLSGVFVDRNDAMAFLRGGGEGAL